MGEVEDKYDSEGIYDTPRSQISKRKGWVTIRLFISSNLSDDKVESQWLADEVFPDLRLWCQSRKLHLLAWDMPLDRTKDNKSEQVAKVLLAELGQCDENEAVPFFLNLVDVTGSDDDVTIEGFFRDFVTHFGRVLGWSDVATKTMQERLRSDASTSLLILLRNLGEGRIISNNFDFTLASSDQPTQSNITEIYHVVQCGVDGQISTFHCPSNIECFSSAIKNFFQKRLEELYTLDLSPLDPLQCQRDEQEMFLNARSYCAVGREDLVSTVMEYICNGSPSSAPLIVVGVSGAGKTTFMSRCVDKTRRLIQEGKLKFPGTIEKCVKIFFHFVGATPRSTHLASFLQRLNKELKPEAMEVPCNLDSLVNLTYNTLQNETTEPVIVFLDALNQMDTDNQDFLKRWLPEALSINVRIIISTIEGTLMHRMLRSFTTTPREITCGPLDITSRFNIITNLLESCKLEIGGDVRKTLLFKEGSKLPLWLTLACEELNLITNNDKLVEKIASLPNDLIALEESVFARFEEQVDGDLTKACMCLLEVSRHGLLESELLELLAQKQKLRHHFREKGRPEVRLPTELIQIVAGNIQDLGGKVESKSNNIHKNVRDSNDIGHIFKSDNKQKAKKSNIQIPYTEWAIIYGNLKPLLRPCGDPGEGRLDFYHRSLSKAVRKRYFTGEDRQVTYNFWHGFLADYFEGVHDMNRKAEELPYHLEKLMDHDRLVQCLMDWHVFEHMYTEDFSPELLHSWQRCGGYGVATRVYKHQLAALRSSEMHLMEYTKIVEKVYGFFIQAGRYEEALELIKERLENELQCLGGRARELADIYYNMAWCKSEILKAEIVYGGADDDRMIVEYCMKSIEYRNSIASSDNEYRRGLSYIMVAHHRSEVADIDAPDPKVEIEKAFEALAEADKIFQKLNDLGHIAECIMTKAIIDRDMPIEKKEPLLFEALDLCLKGYGERHVLLRRIYANMADMYDYFRMEKLAFKYYVKTRDTDLALFGLDHPKTQRSLNLLKDEPYATMLKVMESTTAETA